MISYEGRMFRPVVNSPNGQVTGETLFYYSQSGDLVTVVYRGGGIKAGQMIGTVKSDGSIETCYQHVTVAGELRSGFCLSRPVFLESGRLQLHESWRWTYPEISEGTSVIEEVPSAN